MKSILSVVYIFSFETKFPSLLSYSSSTCNILIFILKFFVKKILRFFVENNELGTFLSCSSSFLLPFFVQLFNFSFPHYDFCHLGPEMSGHACGYAYGYAVDPREMTMAFDGGVQCRRWASRPTHIIFWLHQHTLEIPLFCVALIVFWKVYRSMGV